MILYMRAMALFGIGSAFPVALAVADETSEQVETAAARRADSNDDIFHAAIMFDRFKGDFVVRGIYTVEAEANAHVERLKAAGHKPCVSFAVNRAWLQNHFIGERMGAMQDVLERVEARLMIDAH